MATAADIISTAFRKIEVTTYTTAQETEALTDLNNVLSLLGADGLAECVTAESFSLVVADSEYTIGSGGQFDTVRPLRVLSCYLRDANSYDWNVKVIASKDYFNLSNKSFSARPTELYYRPEYSLGKILFNTSPDYAYTAYFEFVKNLPEFAATTDTVDLPNEYKEFLVYNLAVSLGEGWGRTIKPSVLLRAKESREIIDRMLASQRPPRRARFDFAGLRYITDTGYNVETDETIDGGAF